MAAAMLACRYLLMQRPGIAPSITMFAMMFTGGVTYIGGLWLTKPRRVMALWQESAGDIRKISGALRKKLSGILNKLGWAAGTLK